MDFSVLLAVIATAALASVGYWLLYRRYRKTIGKVTFLLVVGTSTTISFISKKNTRFLTICLLNADIAVSNVLSILGEGLFNVFGII